MPDPLVLGTTRAPLATGVTFADERERAGRLPGAPANAVASVTLATAWQSWGEFFTLDELILVEQWLVELLADISAPADVDRDATIRITVDVTAEEARWLADKPHPNDHLGSHGTAYRKLGLAAFAALEAGPVEVGDA